MSGAIRSLGQVSVPARELPQAIALYRDALGLPCPWHNDRMAFLQAGGVRLLVEMPERAESVRGSILYFDVADIDQAVDDLKGRGVVFGDEPHHIGDLGAVAVWMAFFRDSEGNLMAVQSERSIG